MRILHCVASFSILLAGCGDDDAVDAGAPRDAGARADGGAPPDVPLDVAFADAEDALSDGAAADAGGDAGSTPDASERDAMVECLPPNQRSSCLVRARVPCGPIQARNSCGELVEVDCGACSCTGPVADGTFSHPAHIGYVHWNFDVNRARSLESIIDIRSDPGTGSGYYLASYNRAIDETQFYGGIQTDVFMPGVGPVGKGVVFSRWDTLDPADTRVADGGFREIGTHEGEFVGVRLPFDWTTGTYRLRIERGEADGNADWFNMSIVDVATGVSRDVGGLRFPRADASEPAAVILGAQRITTFLEIYFGPTTYPAVTPFEVGTLLLANDERPSNGLSEYPAVPFAEFPNIDIVPDFANELVVMSAGPDVARCRPPSTVWVP